jgi:hypothetical protein
LVEALLVQPVQLEDQLELLLVMSSAVEETEPLGHRVALETVEVEAVVPAMFLLEETVQSQRVVVVETGLFRTLAETVTHFL